MSTKMKSAIYLAIAFATTAAIATFGWAMGWHRAAEAAVPVIALSMIGPAVGALVCVFAFEKGRRVEALGLHFKPNLWWLWAWLIPVLLAAASVLFSVMFSENVYVDIGAASRMAAEAQGQDLSDVSPALTSTAFIVAFAVIVGGLINAVLLTFSEELGWRGYLHHLWRPFGFWRASLGTGLVWGLWHAPAILIYGHNYPDNRAIGVGLFTVFCLLMSPILTYVRDRGGSVWAAGIFHGVFNAVGGLTLAMLSQPVFPWNGIVGIGGFLALAIGVAVIALMVMQPWKAQSAGGAEPSAR